MDESEVIELKYKVKHLEEKQAELIKYTNSLKRLISTKAGAGTVVMVVVLWLAFILYVVWSYSYISEVADVVNTIETITEWIKYL